MLCLSNIITHRSRSPECCVSSFMVKQVHLLVTVVILPGPGNSMLFYPALVITCAEQIVKQFEYIILPYI